MGKYDIVAFLPAETPEEQASRQKVARDLLRDFTPDEHFDAKERWGNPRHWVTIYQGPTGNGDGWAAKYYDEKTMRPFMMVPTMARAYWGAAEFKPTDFKWEKVEGQPAFYGGILLNEKMRRKP